MSHLLSGILILVLLLNLAGCSDARDPRLERVNALTLTNPQAAMAALDSIDPATLNDADRHFRDLLTVKSSYKSFVKQTSDSLIISVIAHYNDHGDNNLRAEALYYGGAVYVDLGDYPKAMNLYHDALDLLGTNENLLLRSLTLSAIGSANKSLRMWKQAVPYIEESITLDSIFGDSIGMMLNLEQLGFVFMRMKEYDLAETKYRRAHEIAQQMSPKHIPSTTMHLAGLEYERGHIDSALSLIRKLPELDTSPDSNMTFAYAAMIYHEIGIPDSALMYAYKLVHSDDISNKITGYEVLLSPEIRKKLPIDSVYTYISGYLRQVENYLDRHEAEEAIIQETSFNYGIHQKAREKAEQENSVLVVWLALSLMLVAILGGLSVFLKYRSINKDLRYRYAENQLKVLDKKIHEMADNDVTEESIYSEPANEPVIESKPEEIRHNLLKTIMEMRDSHTGTISVNDYILTSDIYIEIKECVKSNSSIRINDDQWSRLEDAVLKISPEFKKHLLILTKGKLESEAYHRALLLKCGFKPSQAAMMMGRSRNTELYWRHILCNSIFNNKEKLNELKDLILLL